MRMVPGSDCVLADTREEEEEVEEEEEAEVEGEKEECISSSSMQST